MRWGLLEKETRELDLSQDGKAHGGGPQTLVWGVQHDLPPPRDESGHECGLLSVLVELEGVRWHVGRPPPVSWVLPSGVSRKNTGA